MLYENVGTPTRTGHQGMGNMTAGVTSSNPEVYYSRTLRTSKQSVSSQCYFNVEHILFFMIATNKLIITQMCNWRRGL